MDGCVGDCRLVTNLPPAEPLKMESTMGVYDDLRLDELAVEMNRVLEEAIALWGNRDQGASTTTSMTLEVQRPPS